MSKEEIPLKVCVIGSNTELNRKFGLLTTSPGFSVDFLPTLGYNLPFKRMKIDDQKVKLFIMTLSGKQFHSKLRPNYYRGVSGCIIIFDKGEKKSLDTVTGWYKELKNNVSADTIPIVIVGIKTDHEEISTEKSHRFAKQLNLGYYETKIDDLESIVQIIHDVALKALAYTKNHS